MDETETWLEYEVVTYYFVCVNYVLSVSTPPAVVHMINTTKSRMQYSVLCTCWFEAAVTLHFAMVLEH